MTLPFTSEQFFDVFRRYNLAVWPAQWLLYALALCAVVFAARGGARVGRYAALVLALLWLWMGMAYHITFFSTVNPAATVFGLLFVVEGGLLILASVAGRRLSFRARLDADGVLGVLLLAYALLFYPLFGGALGHRYPASPTFGLPCPTTIYTFGLLLWAARPVPRAVLAVPVLWALVGTLAVVKLGVWEDLGLPVAAALATARLLPGGQYAAATRAAHAS
jgi:hypothetical protein